MEVGSKLLAQISKWLSKKLSQSASVVQDVQQHREVKVLRMESYLILSLRVPNACQRQWKHQLPFERYQDILEIEGKVPLDGGVEVIFLKIKLQLPPSCQIVFMECSSAP